MSFRFGSAASRAARAVLSSAALPALASTVALAASRGAYASSSSSSPGPSAPADAPTAAAASPAAAPPIVNAPAPGAPARKRVVVLGSGWAAVSFIKSLDPEALARQGIDLTVVSPRGYFLYTPMLPAAAVGSVETRSICEPVRALLPPGAVFYEAAATAVDPAAKTVTCNPSLAPNASFRLVYDVLLVAPGSVNTTMGTPGVLEHALTLKSADDASRFRARVNEAFERAALPTTPPGERERLLSFVVCGGGPTGAELAAELRDLISVDLARLFPALAPLAKITVIDSNTHVLSCFDRRIAEYATSKFKRDGIGLVLGARVKAVQPDAVVITHKADGRKETLPAGTVVWATGVAMHPLAASLVRALPREAQTNARALVVDDRLRVRGGEGAIYAAGDVATVEQSRALAHAEALFKEFDADGSGSLEVEELAALLRTAAARFPQLAEHARLVGGVKGGDAAGKGGGATGKGGDSAKAAAPHHHTPAPASSSWWSSAPRSLALALPRGVGAAGAGEVTDALRAVFAAADTDGSGSLDLNEFRALLKALDQQLRSFPATAQVAKQEGAYLAARLNAGELGPGGGAGDGAPPFAWADMGSMAFIGGDEAVAKLPGAGVVSGVAAGALWRGFETSNQASWRNRVSVFIDQLRTRVFGRDVSTVRKRVEVV